MPIEAVIFDLDGTLIDTIEDIADANNKMLRSFGYAEHELDRYVGWIGNGAKKLVEASLPDNVAKDEESILKYLNLYSKNYQKDICVKTKIFEGIDEVLLFLDANQIPYAINTNKPQSLTDVLMENYFNAYAFQNIIGHSDRFPHKPDPSGALSISKALGKDAKNILFIGDSDVDMQTAIAANMIPLGVNWGYGNPNKANENGDFTVVDRASQIIDFIKNNL